MKLTKELLLKAYQSMVAISDYYGTGNWMTAWESKDFYYKYVLPFYDELKKTKENQNEHIGKTKTTLS